jgi:hypothetical protein
MYDGDEPAGHDQRIDATIGERMARALGDGVSPTPVAAPPARRPDLLALLAAVALMGGAVTPALAPDTGTRPGIRSWQAWSESLATWPRGDWPPAEGLPLHGPDGSACWPHGDHVHCR